MYSDILEHYGTKRHSGRYPYGSGEDPYQHEPWNIDDPLSFMTVVQEGRKRGKTDSEIAADMGISTGLFRSKVSIAKNYQLKEDISRAVQLKEKGYSNVKIGEMMNLPESTVRNYIKNADKDKLDKTQKIADTLKEYVDEKKYVDVGPGTELELNTTDTRLTTALEMLKAEGYSVHKIYTPQMTTDHLTTVSVLVPPGVTYKELQEKFYTFSDPRITRA